MIESNRAARDLGAVFDAHVKAEFVDRNVAATMATMAPEPYLTHVPTLTGGIGRAQVERFYRDHFVGHWPDDVQVKPLSRTTGQNRVVDELVVSFTHDREMRVYLPGVAPTGRKVVLPHVAVMGFDEAGRVAYEHIYWDQAALLVQVGLLDPALLPVAGAEQAKRLLDPRHAGAFLRREAQARGADGPRSVVRRRCRRRVLVRRARVLRLIAEFESGVVPSSRNRSAAAHTAVSGSGTSATLRTS
jgi:carboxymethylenebutenolidase